MSPSSVQILRKPASGRILRPLQRLLLHCIRTITLDSESVSDCWEVLVIKRHTKRRYNFQTVLLQLRRVVVVVFRCCNSS